MVRCPGQDQRFWKLGDIFEVACPHCGTEIEFWKDEPGVKCPQCRRVIVNPRLDLGCAQWCRQAEQCLGTLIDPQSLLCKKLIKETKSVLGPREREINHSLAVLQNAQQILADEQADARVVNAAAILHVLAGPCPALEKPSSGGNRKSAALSGVQEILAKCGVDPEPAERVCQLIAHQIDNEVEDSREANVLRDAERLVALADPSTGPETREHLVRSMQTQNGRALAHRLIGSDAPSHGQAG